MSEGEARELLKVIAKDCDRPAKAVNADSRWGWFTRVTQERPGFQNIWKPQDWLLID